MIKLPFRELRWRDRRMSRRWHMSRTANPRLRCNAECESDIVNWHLARILSNYVYRHICRSAESDRWRLQVTLK